MKKTILLFALACCVSAQETVERPPAVPLVVHDPYFSIWSMADKLTDANTKHWTGAEQALSGLIRIDGQIYRFMGLKPGRSVPPMEQLSLTVTPTHTVYAFRMGGVSLGVTFFTPALPDDVDVLARPVTYLSWSLSATDGAKHSVSIFLDCDPVMSVDNNTQELVWGRAQAGPLTVLSAGSRDQRVLERSGDDVRIDWGYFHLAVPNSEQASMVLSRDAMSSFVNSGTLPEADDLEMPRAPRSGAAHLAVVFPLNIEGSQALTRHVLLAYTQPFSIEYLNQRAAALLEAQWRDGAADAANGGGGISRLGAARTAV